MRCLKNTLGDAYAKTPPDIISAAEILQLFDFCFPYSFARPGRVRSTPTRPSWQPYESRYYVTWRIANCARSARQTSAAGPRVHDVRFLATTQPVRNIVEKYREKLDREGQKTRVTRISSR